ncbi:SCAN domain-containing protein 3 [Trichinella pseudospiralis]|uniref:SCAN domain-containing protein 3 n=1 Tax=Trichinella pseudospiralis TaxID=6337 RepID=A0A0V1J729_TRIPS|nr:SCAN domain-containing protein 3 [Trichinella pseudospiralis]
MTDGAPAMLGSRSSFVKMALVAITLSDDLRENLNFAVEVVNYVKSSALNTRLFAALCESLNADHMALLYYTENRNMLVNVEDLPHDFQEEAIELQFNSLAKDSFESMPLENFWVKLQAECYKISSQSLRILVPFSSKYLCEMEYLIRNTETGYTLRATCDESRILIHVKRLKSILTFTWRGYQPPDCAQTSRSQQLQIKQWEEVIGFVLHSLRTWLLTATYATPHERLFGYQRQTPTGTFLPTWLTTPRIALMA